MIIDKTCFFHSLFLATNILGFRDWYVLAISFVFNVDLVDRVSCQTSVDLFRVVKELHL